jgi:hypothetical protein
MTINLHPVEQARLELDNTEISDPQAKPHVDGNGGLAQQMAQVPKKEPGPLHL